MKSWKSYTFALMLNIGLMLLVLLIKGFRLRIHYVNAFGIAGAVSILLGLLIWVTAAGAFDTLGYGFSSFRFTSRRDKNFYEYTLRKKEKRTRQGKRFLPYLVIGAVFLVISFLIPIE